jgi:hypothetical protein
MNDVVGRACRKLNELKALTRQNFAPAPESFEIYNECVDILIAAGYAAEHYKVDSAIEPLDFRGRLEAVIRDFCESPVRDRQTSEST